MNVYIIGVPTAGKSTLARVLKQRYPQFNVVSFEAIRNGFIRALPNLDMGDRNSIARRSILPEYIVEFAGWNEKMTGNPTLVEGSFASVSKVAKLVQDDIVICLGYGDIGLEEVAHIAISNASLDSYLHGRTEEEFMRHFYDLADDDWANRDFCLKNNIPYFDTSDDRESELSQAAEYVGSRLLT